MKNPQKQLSNAAQIENKIASILGLEWDEGEWRLITRDDEDEKIEYVDYSQEVLELAELLSPSSPNPSIDA